MKWLFKRPENGLIDGKTPAEWEQAGVSRWLVSFDGGTHAVGNPTVLNCFHTDREYAPATAEMMPAPWPQPWQWRRLSAAMDDRTWGAVPRWNYGDRRVDGPRPVCTCDGDSHNVAHEGEWWAPADHAGNPCAWPELEPQPVAVIPAAEMTPLVLYGHLAMGGTWQWQCTAQNGPWVEATANTIGCWRIGKRHGGEQWSPADEHGNFCELRRVVPEAVVAERRRERDELAKEVAEARQELARYRGGVARLSAELEDLLSAGPEVDDDKADELSDY